MTDDGLISKKAPGDRQIAGGEIETLASVIREKEAEGKVYDLPSAAMKEVLSLLNGHSVPPEIASLLPSGADNLAERVAGILGKKEIGISIVDMGDLTGFPRENARPSCEVLLLRRGNEILWTGKKRLLDGGDSLPCIFLTKAFLSKTRQQPRLLLQAIVHPILESAFGFPHMVAVLCESAFNAVPPSSDGTDVSDLNLFIADEAGRDRDFAYFDRILGTSYEPDEFRMEELESAYGADDPRIAEVVSRAQAMGVKYRARMEAVLAETRAMIAREKTAQARKALDEGDADQALQILRKQALSPDTPDSLREEISGLISLAIRSHALNADPGYEGLRMEKGAIVAEPWAGRNAKELASLLEAAADVVRKYGESVSGGAGNGIDPLAERGSPRIIHVIADLERPSGKFIDGHGKVHWVFEKTFIETMRKEMSAGISTEGISSILACRFVRDGAFPDEKLNIDKQFQVAVKGALEGYRFFQSLPRENRERMAAYYEASGAPDPLYRLFVMLGEETNPARAGHLIRKAVSRTHSYNYVRYPDTSLAGKVVVLTGGGTGMGRAIALAAAERGANVVITGRRPAPLEETRADMEDLIRFMGLTNQTMIVQGDVSDPKYVGEMFERIEREFGRIDVLYNNAGVSGPVEFGSAYREEHLDSYRDTVKIHLTGAWLASLEAARLMETQPGGGAIVMVGTFYSESIHPHVLHAYPGRLPYTSAQSAKLALGDCLAWLLAEKSISVLSLNPSAVATERIRKGSGVFDKGSQARARIGRKISPESLERDTLDRTVSHEFVHPRDFAKIALDVPNISFRRTIGGHRVPMGGVTYEQPPGVLPSPAALSRYPDFAGKVALVAVHSCSGGEAPLIEAASKALARSGANVVLAGNRAEELEGLALRINSAGGVGMATVCHVDLSRPSEVQELFDSLPRIDLLLHFTGGIDWKRPLTRFPFEEWSECVDRFGFIPRLLCWQAERRMDRDGTNGTIAIVGPDLSGVPSLRERLLVQIFQAMLRPAVATESMERALMRKAQEEGSAPSPVSDINIGLILPGRTDGRNKKADAAGAAATVLWLLEEGKRVSGAVLLPDEKNSIARLPEEPKDLSGSMAGKVVVVTGGIRNLGKEISLRFAGERATVVAASRRPRAASAAKEDVEKSRAELSAADAALSAMRRGGGRTLWIDADVSNPQKIRALIEETRNRFGGIDAFVNNAGAGGEFSILNDVLRERRPSWDAVMRANFIGPWVAISLLRDLMKDQPKGGTIVNVSTHYADHPYLFRTIYTVSKILLKALTLALGKRLSGENIQIADVAPSLIAGPRMDWVMKNYAGRFAERLGSLKDLPGAEKSSFQERFLRSFDRSLPRQERDAAAKSFLTGIRESSLPKGRREELESWFGRIGDWFAATVPENPPSNEQVADAVLYAVKNCRFLEDRFLGVSTLGSFTTFPGAQPSRKERISGETFHILSLGHKPGANAASAEALKDGGANVISLTENTANPGRVDISRPAKSASSGQKRRSSETIQRDLDMSDPRMLEPWLDMSLLGGSPAAGSILFVGTSADDKPLLSYDQDERESFLLFAGKMLNSLSESANAIRENGHVIVAVPPGDSEEGHLVRAAARQMVRTLLAEQHFLPGGKKIRVSLLTSPRGGPEAQSFNRRVLDILSGAAPPEVEAIPVGHLRP